MKKLFLSLMLLIIFSMGLQAQEVLIVSKKGLPVLPEKGDYALGIDATPLFNFAGNFIKINSGGNFNDPAAFNFMNANNTIFAKYFAEEDMAYRARVRIGHHSQIFKNYVINDNYDGDPADYNPAEDDVSDRLKQSYTSLMLGGGIEWRKGNGRVQGFYGGEAMISYANGNLFNPNEKYTYGNEFLDDNQTPTTTDDFTTGSTSNPGMRTLSVKQGGIFGLGLRAFVGVEYFFAPKLSLGGEFGWGFHYTAQSKTKITLESWNATDEQVEETEVYEANGSEFELDTDNLGGQIYLMFHF